MPDQQDASCPERPFLEFWREYCKQVDGSTQKLLESLQGLALRQTLSPEQRAALGEGMENYLRSPEFLQAMRRSIAALIQTRRKASPSRAPAQSDSEQSDTRSMWSAFMDAADAAPPHGSVDAGATPFVVIHEQETLKVLRFQHPHRATRTEPVLVCSSLVNRPYIVDLHADRSVVRQLLSQGLDVYLIDWGRPTTASQTLGLSEYICDLMKQAVRATCEHARTRRLSLLGYCMGGTMSTMFTSLYGQQVQNLILLAAPIDFSDRQGLLNLWTREDHFDVDGLIDTFGNCPGWFLRLCFQQMKPVQNYVEKALTFRQKMDDDAFLENFFAVERWANDSIPVAGAAFRDFVKLLYQRNRLVQGGLRLQDGPVDLARIDCPLLILTADLDHLVPPGSTLALRRHARSIEATAMHVNAGHIGLAVSSKAHRHLWPDAARWIAQHSTTRRR